MKVLNIIRLILLWTLLSWWMLILIWTLGFILSLLIFGPEETIESLIGISKIFIFGKFEI